MNKKKDKSFKKINISSDELFRKLMREPIAAREFLNEYLPEKLLERLDLNHIKPESESFIEDNLKKRFSDIYSSLHWCLCVVTLRSPIIYRLRSSLLA